MNDTVIKVEGVSKKYCRSLKHTMMYGVADLSRSFLGLDQQTERLRDGEFWAVNDVSFEVKKGETLGLIGLNGSGKSTLLKMLNGIMMPDKGRIAISGRVGALIEVGAGFHPMLTGRENIYINGAIIGMTKKEIDKKFDEIVAFADIDNFIDSPVKHYSSGMYVRLGFAVAVHAEPDILLVDEALAVGDALFQSRCYSKIKSMKDRGTSVILVSHDMNTVQRICRRTLYIEKGKKIKFGDTPDVVSEYFGAITDTIADVEIVRKNGAIRIKDVEILNFNYHCTMDFKTGDDIIIRLYFESTEPVSAPTFSISLKSSDGEVYTGCSTYYDGFKISEINGSGYIDLIIEKPILGPGTYEVNVGVWDEEFFGAYDWLWNVVRLRIKSEHKLLGRFGLTHSWKIYYSESNNMQNSIE